MNLRQAHDRLDFEEFGELDEEWEDGETFQRIRRRERGSADREPRRDAKRKRERRREPPLHKREEP